MKGNDLTAPVFGLLIGGTLTCLLLLNIHTHNSYEPLHAHEQKLMQQDDLTKARGLPGLVQRRAPKADTLVADFSLKSSNDNNQQHRTQEKDGGHQQQQGKPNAP